MPLRALLFVLSSLAVGVAPLFGQERPDFGGLAGGPYAPLAILNTTVIPGHGGPPVGPVDVVIEGGTIVRVGPGAAAGMSGIERTIDGTGRYVMPGMIDLHMHLRTEPMPLEYVYYLKLAHGVTTMVPAPDRGLASAREQAQAAEEGTILAPRMLPIWAWGGGTGFTPRELEDPARAADVAQAMVEAGAHVVSVGTLAWNAELFGAACRAVEAAGGITTVHLPPSTNAVVHAVDAARLGVTMIEHHYGYAEAALDRQVQDFAPDYNYSDENARFRHAGTVWLEADRERLLTEVADSLAYYGVTMLPTRVVYEANRDILRAISLPWHEKYTHEALIQWNLPNPRYHGSYHYDWTSDDEYAWTVAFQRWGELIYAFNRRGGRVAYGTDDNYIWATPGFSNVRELQLLRETGLHPLEVLKAATYNSARTLRRPDLGLVRPGYRADLLVVDGNPVENLRFLYGFGALTRDADGRMVRTAGIVHTIRDGIVTENARLLEAVAGMVAASKAEARPNVEHAPFAVDPP